MGFIVVFPVIVDRSIGFPGVIAGPADVVPDNPTVKPTVTVGTVVPGLVVRSTVVVFPVIFDRSVVFPGVAAGPAAVVPDNPTVEPTVTVGTVVPGIVVESRVVVTPAVDRYIYLGCLFSEFSQIIYMSLTSSVN